RERRTDVPQLISHFIAELTKEGVPRKEFELAAVERLTAQDWPGNIRELKNAVERLLILASGRVVKPADVERLVGKGAGDGGGARWKAPAVPPAGGEGEKGGENATRGARPDSEELKNAADDASRQR